ncbi:hypothetical protein PROVALCAL_01963 [Providencia alcalifaciens DSM 30120]|uniref:Uncharacterized protein n=1 Tax=Providencia alcalifaciens DSM 30120 TaxID=520999 RepID=B6XF32_9GAMM|nr:hypothetical protein PROVALCAL_01963 [Providencia alcalifaciens DSM 30120]
MITGLVKLRGVKSKIEREADIADSKMATNTDKNQRTSYCSDISSSQF